VRTDSLGGGLPEAPGVHEYRHWKPEYQQRALSLLQERQNHKWRPFYCPDPKCTGQAHVEAVEIRDCPLKFGHEWVKVEDAWFCDPERGCGVIGVPTDDWLWTHARADQRPPPWKKRWRTWLQAGGRGSGKTRTGAEVTHRVTEMTPHIILVAPTGPDIRETLVEGESGILATSPPGKRPTWEPSRKRLVWPNGAVARGFSAEEPDRLRGPQSGFIWMDEAAHYPDIEAVWSNALFGLRLGSPSHVLVTSTPRPTKWLKDLMKDERTVHVRVSTYANLANLDPAYREMVIEKYEGTRTGRQELYGELLEDVEGALWQSGMLSYVADEPDLDRIVVAIDPAGTANARSDETGIVVIGWAGKKAYVLADYSGKYSPAGWGARAWKAYEDFSADCIVAEKNYGGDMVEHVLDSASDGLARVKMVTSRRGKMLRAEPIVAQYEKGRVLHVVDRSLVGEHEGNLMKMEEEMLSWVPGEGASPNRVDALVHGLTELFRGYAPAAVADPSKVLKGLGNSTTDPNIPMRGRL
jgi:phage terminase large subunit-like protein